MKISFKPLRLIPILASFFILCFQSTLASPTPQLAPLSSDFQNYQQIKRLKGKGAMLNPVGYPLGYIPPPFKLNLSQPNSYSIVKSVVYPSRYDLRVLGKLPPVRDQGSCGSCWAHGALASLESTLQVAETRDFSEAHLNDTHGFDFSWCEGGNDFMSTAYLTRWSGVGEQSDYPLPSTVKLADPTVKKHVQDVYFINRSGYLDNNAIKTALMNKGAVTVSYFASDYDNYNPKTAAWYNPGINYIDHEVAIVGWDDNYPKTSFTKTPPGNGAFIVRNSWSTGWGENGYFYLSYYDDSIRIGAVFQGVEPVNNYNKVYQYDQLGFTNGVGYGTDVGWFANSFIADNTNTTIQAVSFFATTPNTSYEINIYRDSSSNNPVSGSRLVNSFTTGVLNYAGYHTIRLKQPALVTPNGRFSVVIKLKSPGSSFPIATEMPFSGYSSAAKASSGQSFISYDGSEWSWTDITNYYSNTNVVIKAFAGTALKIPNSFAFQDQMAAKTNTLTESNPITISGLTSTAPITIVGGEYQINTGAYTTVAGSVKNGDVVRVRHVAASSIGKVLHTTVSIGGISDTFSSYTTTSGVTVLYTLTVSKTGTGIGSVSSTPAGISCGTDCQEPYAMGTAVTLKAIPSAGSAFVGWSGACTGTASTCSVSMSAAKTVTASFKLLPKYTLTVLKSGSGTITSSPVGISCGTDCTENYTDSTVVTLTAAPATGYMFAGWGGDCTGSTSTCKVTMSAAKNVKASFLPISSACQTTILLGQTRFSSWSSACAATHRAKAYAMYYTFTLTSTRTVTIDLVSGVDPYLILLSGSGKTGAVLASDDDGGIGFNSRISRSLAAGTYTIEATTYSPASTGSFAIKLQ